MNISNSSVKRSAWQWMSATILACAFSVLTAAAQAQQIPMSRMNGMHGTSVSGSRDGTAPSTFIASNSKSFPQLMGEAMSLMNDGMAQAPMNGNPDHDFAAMMIPHHQGAIDMAKVELLYGKDPVLRRLAQEIIVTQGAEITLMQLQSKKLLAARTIQHKITEPKGTSK
jgi:uncharacterized protein (DUF305 family)